jgi:hypothetical protein
MWKKPAGRRISLPAGYTKKFHELQLYNQRSGMNAPLIGTVYYLTPQFLKVLNRVHVAGVVVPEDLKKKYQGRLLPKKERSRVQKIGFGDLAEYQRSFSIRRAALLADLLVRGFGYRGIDLAASPRWTTPSRSWRPFASWSSAPGAKPSRSSAPATSRAP